MRPGGAADSRADVSVLLRRVTPVPSDDSGRADLRKDDSRQRDVPQDNVMREAERAINDGRPWDATRMLAPLLRDSTRRTPAVVLRAAEAARGWEGWPQVVDLLQREGWLDTEFGGRGNVLLAEAALALSPRSSRTDSLALAHARRALTSGAGGGAATRPAARDDMVPAESGRRHLLVARALDRLDQDDSARTHYQRAAALIPDIADWLLLRAAVVTPQRSERESAYGRLRTAVARDRRAWTEGVARERQRDPEGAAVAYTNARAPVAAFRMRWAAARDSGARDVVRRDMLAWLAGAPPAADARLGIELYDTHTRSRPAADELTIARAAARAGPLSRSAAAFNAAFTATGGAGKATDRDRMSYGDVLLRLDRARDAATQFGAIGPSSPQAGAARYQRARALLRAGDGVGARAALDATRQAFAADTFAAASSLYLLGDLASDAARDSEARAYFLELGKRYPTSASAPAARLRAALMAYAAGDNRRAARELDSIAAAYPAHADGRAAQYWAGRAWARDGNANEANVRFRNVARAAPASYYAMLASEALGERPWAPDTAAGGGRLRQFADIDSSVKRAALLEAVGMNDEARWEDDALAARATGSTGSSRSTEVAARLAATAAAFSGRGNASRAIAFARIALDSGAAPDAATYRLLYPVMQGALLRAESERRGLDAALVAALIRQESNFTPRAVSAVGARGLMQVMPSVGKSIAPSVGITDWDPALLFQPDVNVRIGVRHLAGSLARYEHPTYALAAYNAGESRARRWRTKRGATSDPALFVELIPYVETRDYVRIVLRNRAFYRALYGWTERAQ